MYRMNPSEAEKWVTEAERKISLNTGIMKFFFGGPKKIDDAIECYKKAGNLYKMNKNWSEAGSCFGKAAGLNLNENNKHQAALDYEQAALCYKKTNAEEAERYFLKSIDIYLDLGRFNIAAKIHESIAGMYESDPDNINKVLTHFEKAADYYKGEESTSSTNRCLLKVAQYSAETQRYDKAVHIYEKIAVSSLKSNLLKYGVKDYFFKAAICKLCEDEQQTKINLDKYVKIYPAFSDCREYKFCRNLLKTIEEQNVDGFTDVVQEFDSIQTLDSWFTTLLLRIKRKLTQELDLR